MNKDSFNDIQDQIEDLQLSIYGREDTSLERTLYDALDIIARLVAEVKELRAK